MAAHGLPASPDELAGHACVTTSRGRDPRVWTLSPREGGPASEVPIHPVIVANDMNFVRSAVEAGAGIGTLPELFGDRGLVRVLPDWVVPGVTLSMVWPAARSLSPRVRAFLDLMPRFVSPGRCPG